MKPEIECKRTISIDKQREILHRGFLDFEKYVRVGGSKGFYYFLMNVWTGLEEAGHSMQKPLTSVDILIIDDDETKVDLLSDFFGEVAKRIEIKIDVYKAYNGQAAISMLDTMHFNIVLSDNEMPIVRGIEAFEHFRNFKQFLDTDWFWICAFPDDVEQTFSYENVQYFEAPYSIARLHEMVLSKINRVNSSEVPQAI